jgi:hypothetical protein
MASRVGERMVTLTLNVRGSGDKPDQSRVDKTGRSENLTATLPRSHQDAAA